MGRCASPGSGTSRLAPTSDLRPLTSDLRLGISLMEVLISMFVLLFGLMGVAAIFPVGNHYVVEGEKFDQGSILAQNAFEELQARGMLRPEYWLYSEWPFTSATDSTFTGNTAFIRPSGIPGAGTFNAPFSGPPEPLTPYWGYAFVIDPMGISATSTDEWAFPASAASGNNPWIGEPLPSVPPGLRGNQWPVRRMTLPIPDPNYPGGYQHMTTPVAETIFRLRDDLAVELPDRDDVPGIERWNLDNNGTPADPTDDTLLTRQYLGNYSWLATVVPKTDEALEAMQPALRSNTQQYEVSVVVFYKRDTTPSADSERLINAEMLGIGELALYDPGNDPTVVDDALKDIKAGDWIALMGVNQTTGTFVMKWYRLLALDEETQIDQNMPSGVNGVALRYAMLTGPDWPRPRDPSPPPEFLPATNLRAAILPGVASVVTREMVLEGESLWNTN